MDPTPQSNANSPAASAPFLARTDAKSTPHEETGAASPKDTNKSGPGGQGDHSTPTQPGQKSSNTDHNRAGKSSGQEATKKKNPPVS